MKHTFFSIIYMMAIVIFAIAFAACENGGENKMSLTINIKGNVSIFLAGSGSAAIDWGDGTKKGKYELTYFGESLFWDEEREDEYTKSHYYSGTSVRTITITGKNITRLDCSGLGLTNLEICNYPTLIMLGCRINQLTNLDVSNNMALTTLGCGSNQLTSLDVSNNPVLTILSCENNQLTSLDVSNNFVLTSLVCKKNKLTSLDVSKCSELSYVSCSGNLFSAEALNALFNTLPLRPEEKEGVILIPEQILVIGKFQATKDGVIVSKSKT